MEAYSSIASVTWPILGIPLCGCMIQYFFTAYCVSCPGLFIHSPVDRHLGCFQFGAVMNKSVMNILVAGFCELMFSFFLDKYRWVELLGRRVDVSLTFFLTAEWPNKLHCTLKICAFQFYYKICKWNKYRNMPHRKWNISTKDMDRNIYNSITHCNENNSNDNQQ
jgi:hypothetical protein